MQSSSSHHYDNASLQRDPAQISNLNITSNDADKEDTNKVQNKPLVDRRVKILLIGPTGAGKSSLINLFYVWSKGWGLQDIAQSPDVLIKTEYLGGDGSTDNNVTDTSHSQTSYAKMYEFVLEDHKDGYRYHLTFLDTPGMGDTRGLDEDTKHLNTILDTVSNTPDLNAILIVANGAHGRITKSFTYVMTMLQGMIPDALSDNLFALLTNVSSVPNLDINKVLDSPIPDDRMFYYQNEIFKVNPSKFSDHNTSRSLSYSFPCSMETLSSMLKRVSICTLRPTVAFRQIKESRDQLKQKLIACSDANTKIQRRKLELQDLAKQVASGDMQLGHLDKHLNQSHDEEYVETIDTPYHNTTCLTCKNYCHEQCGLQEVTDQGNQGFMGCWAFAGGSTCHQCHHDVGSHVHLRLKYHKTMKKVSRVDSQVQKNLLLAQNSQNAKVQTQQTIDAENKRFDQELTRHHQEIKKIILDMQKVCSRFNYMKEVEACINVLCEQIDVATSDSSMKPTRDNLKHLASLTETKKKMDKLMQDLIDHLTFKV